MTAKTIAQALGGKSYGNGWMACCPVHDDRRPSLSIRNSRGQVLVRCFAGCDRRDIIAALIDRDLWDGAAQPHPGREWRFNTPKPKPQLQQADRRAAALSIWQSTLPAAGTPVEAYLASRGLCLPPLSLRFHPRLKHPSGGFWPGMVALVKQGDRGHSLGIHRTFLAHDGSGKAPVDPVKMMLGPCRGGAVRLSEFDDVLMIGEGIETCLSAMLATGHPAWSALSTSGMRTLNLPESVREVIVLADGEDEGDAAARNCGLRWRRQGRRVRIARPPRGMDFNDLLMGCPPRIKGGAQ